ncbi:DUF4843 domain-containing protein [Pedobacter nyackensis]|uniref:DUF4843 domain-containing protein n=1 Tax=Pedobacter nyackensis TaxID=475255 RepID=A0A1W2EL74_9SPHI|nr:DUF4843 domain-containing protein [Pedobacter nyackensis]SMD10395.1 protein of unknown function [Pedobacter nyackensis]
MKTIFHIHKIQFLSLILLLIMASCKKEELMYEDKAGIYIDKEKFVGVRDSTSYSFAEKANTVMLDTIYIPVKISGNMSPVDRIVPLKVDENLTTALAGTHYQILETKIKANEITGRVPILIKRTADLKAKQVRLYVKIATSAEFPLQIMNTKTNNTFNGEPVGTYVPGYLIKLSDQLLKPDTWDASGSWFKLFFGTYSATKYKFIIDITGRVVWGPRARDSAESPTAAQMYIYLAKLVSALYEYEKVNGPMIDETGNQVTFPKL